MQTAICAQSIMSISRKKWEEPPIFPRCVKPGKRVCDPNYQKMSLQCLHSLGVPHGVSSTAVMGLTIDGHLNELK